MLLQFFVNVNLATLFCSGIGGFYMYKAFDGEANDKSSEELTNFILSFFL